ncbi:MAG: HAMP domain-containing sensor histidine kinase [Candidatus Scalindua sp.]|nr:HAMP domain-containing sensor histidine kinase [Candidatus Scalindua sp.]MDV5166618.1 HAMP domain-containing sensor histidine kinase [Candidatus Scalindua sp.]
MFDSKYMVAIPVVDTNGNFLFSVLALEKAVKREKRRENSLQLEKMNSLRTVVAGVAHEFNNILAIVHGSAEVMEDSFENKKELKKGLHNIEKASDRGAGIVRSMITFAKTDKDTSEYLFFDLKQLIVEVMDSTMPGWKNIAHFTEMKYKIDRNGMKRIPGVFCDPTELREVFINIVNNALDAMPDGGSISFSTWSNEDTVFVKISDTGLGMSEEVKNQMFDPFFTTRRSERTGLGLGVAYSIIKRHGGKIEVESEEGRGTAVTLSLPINNENRQQKISL